MIKTEGGMMTNEDLFPTQQMLHYQKTIKRWMMWHLYGSANWAVFSLRAKVRESLESDYIISDEAFDLLISQLLKEGYIEQEKVGNHYILNLSHQPG